MLSKRKSYSEMLTYNNFEDRFNYLKFDQVIGHSVFGSHRILNQKFYRGLLQDVIHNKNWLDVRKEIIFRDNGCDLGIKHLEIQGTILVHHINPITEDEICRMDPVIFDPENLITVSESTHSAIHFGNNDILLTNRIIIRTPNDTCPWKR